MSWFQSIIDPPPDAPFFLVETYARDTFSQKVDLCPGFYRDEDSQPWVLPSLYQVSRLKIFYGQVWSRSLGKEASTQRPIHQSWASAVRCKEINFGDENIPALGRIASIQTIGGTGANHLGALFLSKTLRPVKVWIPDPSWIAHPQIWE